MSMVLSKNSALMFMTVNLINFRQSDDRISEMTLHGDFP